MSGWPRVIDDQYNGDPFVKLIEVDDKRYLFNEASLIEQQANVDQSFAMRIRLLVADAFIRKGWPW